MRTVMIAAAAMLLNCTAGSVSAQDKSTTPKNSATPAKEADKMKSGDAAGSAPNSSNPGANPGADGNKTQDSRTTKDKQR